MIKIHRDFNQHSQQWHDIRRTHIGSSKNVMAVKGKKHPSGLGVSAIDASYRIAANVMGWFDPDEEGFTNPAMEAGNEFEPYARDWYESETFNSVDEVGYITMSKWFGYSPDGLVGDHGLIEIKCPQGKGFAKFALTGVIDPDHIKQMQWGLWVSGREWCDYVVFNQYTMSGIIKRVEVDEDMHALFWKNAEAFDNLMTEHLKILKS